MFRFCGLVCTFRVVIPEDCGQGVRLLAVSLLFVLPSGNGDPSWSSTVVMVGFLGVVTLQVISWHLLLLLPTLPWLSALASCSSLLRHVPVPYPYS